MAESIKKFIIKDAHGGTKESGSFSVVGEVHVDIVPGYGEPYAESNYVNGILTITIHNIEGNGITEITTDSQEGDEAVNTVTIKTNANPEGVVLEVRNGSRGNGIASSSEVLSPEDGGTNTHTIIDTDGNEHVFHTKNGRKGDKGDQGDSAVYDPSSPDAPDFEMANTPGQSTTKAMTQKAVTDAVMIAQMDGIISAMNTDKAPLAIPVTSGVALSYTIPLFLPSGTAFKLYLPSTALLDGTGGLNLFFGYADGTSGQSSITEDSEKSLTASKDIVSIRFQRGSTSVVGTGQVIVEAYFADNLSDKVDALSDIPSRVDALEKGAVGTLSLTTATGYYYDSSGTKTSNSSSSYNELMDVSAYAGKKIRITLASDYVSDARCHVLKDSKGAVIEVLKNTDIVGYTGKTAVFSHIIETGYQLGCSWLSTKSITVEIDKADVSDIITDIEKIGALSNQINELDNYVIGETDFNIPVTQGVAVDFYKTMTIPANKEFFVEMPNTDKVDGNGFNLFFKYEDDTSSVAQNIKPGDKKSWTLQKAVKWLNFVRGASGIVGTGDIAVSVALDGTVKQQLETLQQEISAIDIANVIMYIKPNGDDTKDGLTPENAKATINSALQGGAEIIMLDGGEYTMNIDLTKTSRGHVSIKGLTGKKVIIKAPNSVLLNDGSEEAVDGYTNVYKMALATAPGDGIKLFFDGLNDAETAIVNSERRPEQGGKFYRCDCTQVIKSTAGSLNDALDDIEESTTFKWYHSDGYLYFKRSESDTSVHPLVKPINTTHITYGSSAWRPIDLEITNVEFRYAVLKLERLQNARLCCVASKYVYGSGAFVYDKCINVVFDHCEAARCFSGQYGDGFNAHATSSDAGSKGTYATLTNCWSHDNTDDGYSDHEYSETMIIGGLFEYNGKAGVTPSFGSHLSAHDVYSRHNYCGFYYIGGAQDGGNGGQMALYNCISDSNTAGGNLCGFLTDSTSQAILYNCVAMNETTGYKTSNTSTMQLIDCKVVNCTTAKSGPDITVITGTNLT